MGKWELTFSVNEPILDIGVAVAVLIPGDELEDIETGLGRTERHDGQIGLRSVDECRRLVHVQHVHDHSLRSHFCKSQLFSFVAVLSAVILA